MKIPRLIKYGGIGLGAIGAGVVARRLLNRRRRQMERNNAKLEQEERLIIPAISSQPHPLIKHLKGRKYNAGHTIQVGKDGRGRDIYRRGSPTLVIDHIDPSGHVRFTNGHLLPYEIHQQDLKLMALGQIEGKRYLKAKNTSAAALKRYKKKNLDLRNKYLAALEKEVNSKAFREKAARSVKHDDQLDVASGTLSRLKMYKDRGDWVQSSSTGALGDVQAVIAKEAEKSWGDTGRQVEDLPRSIDPLEWYKAGKAV